MAVWIAGSAALLALVAAALQMPFRKARAGDRTLRPPARADFERRLALEVERAHRDECALALIVAEIDGLDQIDALLGRRASGVVADQVGAIMRDAARRPDFVVGLESGRFALVLYAADERGALGLARRLVEEVREAFAGGFAEVTLSLGLASYPHHGEDAARLLATANRALALARDAGGNRAVAPGDQTAGSLSGTDGV